MSFRSESEAALANRQLRSNLGRATATIRAKRGRAIAELPDWNELRAAAAAMKDGVLGDLDDQLDRLEERVSAAGGTVHRAADAAQANRIVGDLAVDHGAGRVAKVKSIATDEIGLNEALSARGIEAVETDLAELIVQLADDKPSHILVPAIHRNRREIRDIFRAGLGEPDLGDDPGELAEAARRHLRRLFLETDFAVSGANFGIAETGSICVVESEGNGRMCTTLPSVLVTVMGVEKLLAHWLDLEVFLQLLPRSATGERMNPYTSIWTGVREGDGPREFHLVLLDAGRRAVLDDPVGRQALRCIRCSACLNVCPVYSRVGGHAYESVYPGPIGAILTPQLRGMAEATDLPGASSLCGACAEVCPVAIDIPEVLVHLRGRALDEAAEGGLAERASMRLVGSAMSSRLRFEAAQAAARVARPALRRGPLPAFAGPLAAWTERRDAPSPARESFRQWWRRSGRPRTADGGGTPRPVAGEAPSPPRNYRRVSGLDGPAKTALFVERVAAYQAQVDRVLEKELPDRLSAIGARHGAGRMAIASGVPGEWLPPRPEFVAGEGISPRDLDRLDGCLTGCALGIAETGTIVLDGGPESGPRALTLVPDLHVCVVFASRIVGGVPEAVSALRNGAEERRPLTFVSGPSATSDIELSRVEGVHGPRRLEVLVIEDR